MGTNQKTARTIMGKNYWGIEEWKEIYGIEFFNKTTYDLNLPWKEETLNGPCPFYKDKSLKETHFAFLGLERVNGNPLTILEWERVYPGLMGKHFESWYASEFFAKKKCDFGWYLMLLEIVPDSDGRPLLQQKNMMPPGYTLAYAVEETTKLILYYRKNGIYLNQEQSARCWDICSDKTRVTIGPFNEKCLSILKTSHVNFFKNFGTSASRRVFH